MTTCHTHASRLLLAAELVEVADCRDECVVHRVAARLEPAGNRCRRADEIIEAGFVDSLKLGEPGIHAHTHTIPEITRRV